MSRAYFFDDSMDSKDIPSLEADVEQCEDKIRSIRQHIAHRRNDIEIPSPLPPSNHTHTPTHRPAESAAAKKEVMHHPEMDPTIDAVQDDGAPDIAFPGVITTADHTLLVDQEDGRCGKIFCGVFCL